MKDVVGKVAVVTGAGSGIGRAIAVELARVGSVVALADIDAETVDAAAAELRESGAIATAHVVDVSDERSVESLVAAVIEAHGHVNILVNNAGVVALGRFEDVPLDDVAWLIGINVWGVIYGTRHVLPHMPSGDGHIVNIVSAAGIYAEPGRSAYALSKFGVRGFSEALRLELAERDIGVSAVYPGIIKTNIAAATRTTSSTSGSTAASPVKAHPPEDVAEKVLHAIRRNKPKVLVGRETYLLDIGSRVAPSLFPRLVRRITG